MPKEFDLNNIKNTFFIESREMMDEMERCLLELEKNNNDPETINTMFRTIHTIKGSSGLFGFAAIERFAHVTESILDKLRKGSVSIDRMLSPLLFECHDFMLVLLDFFSCSESNDIPAEMQAKMNSLIERITNISKQSKNESFPEKKEIHTEKDNKKADRDKPQSENNTPVMETVPGKKHIVKKEKNDKSNILKINTDKINGLIKHVGELVIRGSNIKQLAEKIDDSELTDSVSDMARLIEEIRNSTMSMRMVPICDTFRRFERIVHDLGGKRGKEIDLVITGDETELDKILTDKISDPLIHLVRNAIDHGIEMPEERLKKGKSRRGTIYLNAYYEMGNVVIAVSDDGSGLSRDRIYQKGVEKGYIQNGEDVPDDDLFQLIFQPGFSTAKEITNISGRGVGMDVVKRNVESLQGSVTIESIKNCGTTIKITLPLTLAIIDGFMVQVGNYHYIIPLDMVVECTDLKKEDIAIKKGGDFINLRGDIFPYIRLREFFDVHDSNFEKENTIIVEYASKKTGIVVDRPEGKVQAVIKPLGDIFSGLGWLCGATILGNGDIALILDIPKLVQKTDYKSIAKIA